MTVDKKSEAASNGSVPAIEIRGLTKDFHGKQALSGLNMTVPQGAVYGFIGENGSGKSTTEKIVCGLMQSTGGTVKLFGRDVSDAEARAQIGVLIEAPGCYEDYSVWNNMMLHATNLELKEPEAAVSAALKTVRMEGAAGNKFKRCSLGMKQRVGIAMALLGDPTLLVLDEPINGLDADGMRVMREVLRDLAKGGRTVLVSSHILSELEKIATHYGIVRGGRMIKELTADELAAECRTYTALRSREADRAKAVLFGRYSRVEDDEEVGWIRVYDADGPSEVVSYLRGNGVAVSEVTSRRVSLEEYYTDLTHMKEGANHERARIY